MLNAKDNTLIQTTASVIINSENARHAEASAVNDVLKIAAEKLQTGSSVEQVTEWLPAILNGVYALIVSDITPDSAEEKTKWKNHGQRLRNASGFQFTMQLDSGDSEKWEIQLSGKTIKKVRHVVAEVFTAIDLAEMAKEKEVEKAEQEKAEQEKAEQEKAEQEKAEAGLIKLSEISPLELAGLIGLGMTAPQRLELLGYLFTDLPDNKLKLATVKHLADQLGYTTRKQPIKKVA